MIMNQNNMRILTGVIKADVVFEDKNGAVIPFFDSISDSPLMHSAQLRSLLKKGAQSNAGQGTPPFPPFLYSDSYACYFAAIETENGCVYIGPMCHEKLGKIRAKEMVRSYSASAEDMRGLRVFTLPEIRNVVLLVYTSATGYPSDVVILPGINDPEQFDPEEEKAEQQRFLLKEEEENDDESYRHSYHEELLLMQAVREGCPKEAVRLAENMDHDAGRLSKNYIRHRRNLAIIGTALCARAAIEGGLPPEVGYRISGYYIAKLDAVQDAPGMLKLRNRAIEELAGRVEEKLNKPGSSSYIEKAKDYIRKHYREKIYLADAAEILGISEGYLSRLFRQETGETFQDYINEERVNRASNLLLYSDLSLTQIAEYVNFPNQSYFGKIFKKYKKMTPRAFRDRYRNREAFG